MRKLATPNPNKINRLFEIVHELNKAELKRAKKANKDPDLWTQQKLSQEARISFAQVNGYFLGKREPSLETIMRLAKALRISPRELLPEDSF